MTRTRLAVMGLVVVAAALALALRRDGTDVAPGLASPPTASDPAPDAPRPKTPAALAPRPRGAVAPDVPGEPTSSDSPGFVGRIETIEGDPAEGATIDVVVGTEVRATCLADATGTFRFRLELAPSAPAAHGLLRARGRDDSAAQHLLGIPAHGGRGAHAPQEPIDVGVLRLGSAHALDVQVTTLCPASQPATVWLVAAMLPPETPFAVREADATGALRFEGVPAGHWMLVAVAPGCARARTAVNLPRRQPEPVDMTLGEPHTLTVRVVDAADTAPVANATVEVAEFVTLPQHSFHTALLSSPSRLVADAAGVARIEGLAGNETLALSAHATGYPKATGNQGRRGGPGEVRVVPGQTEVTIALHRAITVRWPLTDDGIGVPPHGSSVTLEPWTNTGRLVVPQKGTIEGRDLVVSGWGADGASGYAVFEGRAAARLHAGPRETTGHPTAFYPMRRVELALRHEDGTPASGWFLVVRDGGNNAVKPSVETDAQGRAAMEGLYSGPASLVQVSASDRPEDFGGYVLPLGSVDLAERDGRFDAVVPAERTFLVRLTVDGRAPRRAFPGRPTVDHVPVRAEALDATEVAGRFRVTWRPKGRQTSVVVSAMATGFRAESKAVELATHAPQDEVVVDLMPTGTVRIRLKEPADRRHRIVLHRWDSTRDDFRVRAPDVTMPRQADPDGVVEIGDVTPGRYRAADAFSGVTSAPFDVAASDQPTVVDLDLSATGWVKGRVVVPEGTSLALVRVGEVDAGQVAVPDQDPLVAFLGRAGVASSMFNPMEGTFWVRVAGTRPVTLRPYHPTLAPHPTEGRRTVTGPAEGLELRLVAGPTARLRLATPAHVASHPGQPSLLTVRLYPGPVEGPGRVLSGLLDAEHRHVEFGGYPPGSFTVWLDVPGVAPIIRSGVTLGPSDADLGEVAVAPGASLELRVTVKDGQSPPRYAVRATRLDEPAYTRSTDAAGARIVLGGLGAGRFHITAFGYDGAAPPLNELIEFDGRTTVVRDLVVR